VATRRRAGVFALIAAGGTGGHVYPGIALAQTLARRGVPAMALRFVTDRRTASSGMLRDGPFPFDVLPIAHGLARRFSPRNIVVVVAFARALVRSVILVHRYRPEVVVGFGSYAALPVVLAARLAHIPIVVHEQNTPPGVANRVAVRLGATAAVSLPDTPLRGAVLTGNAVRPAITALEREPQVPPLIAFVGASLGSARLNDTALGLYEQWRDRDDVAVCLVSGRRFHEQSAARLAAQRVPGDRLEFELLAYADDIGEIYRRAALVVTRAGGMIAEIAAAGVPSVLVPWPGAAERHQEANAAVFASAGASIVVPDQECDADRIAAVVGELLSEPARLADMSAAARSLARPDAAERLADMVESAAHG
jgi:UDP-N-acetylglucosamine--N-acetylmuramyl-(pentapeptide) pyrophosphoryl-undecaprenol N-acetylglucosamine transferase